MTGRRMIGILLLVIGAIAVAVYVFGIVDPAGAQLADDSDPFGAPPPRKYGVIGLAASLAVVGAGVWLACFGRPPNRRP